MEILQHIESFYDAVSENPKISVTHISLYMSLLLKWHKQGCKEPFGFRRVEIMRDAKINSRHTYNKCINELQENGLLRYRPASNHVAKSCIYFIVQS